MTVPALVLADAVVAAINAATLSLSVTATREHVPKFDIQDASSVQIKVVPASDSREMGSAACDNATIAIDIGVMKRLQETTENEKAEIDGLMELVEELRGVVNRQSLVAGVESRCTETSQDAIYDVKNLDESRIFLTSLTATFLYPVAVA